MLANIEHIYLSVFAFLYIILKPPPRVYSIHDKVLDYYATCNVCT